MTGREVVSCIIDKEGMTTTEFALKCGVSVPAMWDRLNSTKVKDIPLSTLNEMLRVLGYKIMVVPFAAKADKDYKDSSYHVDGKKSVFEKSDKRKKAKKEEP